MLLALPLVLWSCGESHDEAVHKHDHHDEKASAPSDKAKDPVCGMEVSKATAKKADFDKADFYLCTDECLKKFIVEPAKYAKACTCAKTMKDCDCGHCGGKREPCNCGKEKK
jgi:YHS domain-containing protein